MPKNQPIVLSKQSANKLVSLASIICVLMGCMVLIFLMIVLQESGVYLFTPLVLDEQVITIDNFLELGSANGTVISLALLFTSIIMSGLIVVLAKMMLIIRSRHDHGISERSIFSFLALKPLHWRLAFHVLGVFVVYTMISEIGLYLLDKSPAEFIHPLYTTAQSKILLIVVVVVAVPIYEELMFRGIMWSTLRQQIDGRGGVWLASILTSILFALVHAQYDWLEMITIGLLALVFSYARVHTGSIVMPILLHILNNALAMMIYFWA